MHDFSEGPFGVNSPGHRHRGEIQIAWQLTQLLSPEHGLKKDSQKAETGFSK